ncbi:hypothetical protein HDV00_007719 [Rhizophlyctis rosea]|nr:hypothetical protein HDV00_007719 [Rhizophlyctis rosea]
MNSDVMSDVTREHCNQLFLSTPDQAQITQRLDSAGLMIGGKNAVRRAEAGSVTYPDVRRIEFRLPDENLRGVWADALVASWESDTSGEHELSEAIIAENEGTSWLGLEWVQHCQAWFRGNGRQDRVGEHEFLAHRGVGTITRYDDSVYGLRLIGGSRLIGIQDQVDHDILWLIGGYTDESKKVYNATLSHMQYRWLSRL